MTNSRHAFYERPPFPGFENQEKLAQWIERVRTIAFFKGARHGEIDRAEAKALSEEFAAIRNLKVSP